jgi:aminoglycoside phosphotransferase (APT) family kinase protein
MAAMTHPATARRLEWRFLPTHIRALVEQHCGSPVVEAASQPRGFTPGFASVLTCADGSRHFVKAASVKAQRMIAGSYREEARKLAMLPADVPAPRLLWSHDDDWVVLGIEYVDARNPPRPWRLADLDACLDALEAMVPVLTPPPPGLELDTFAEEYAVLVGAWGHVRTTRPELPHLEEAAELAGRFAEVTAGDTLVHTDIRDDNLMIDADGQVWICDWNWPTLGAAWMDTVFALIGPRGDGLDTDAVLRDRALTRDLPAESVDVVLALLTGYFFKQCDEPVPPTSPHLRDHQRWQGEVVWTWLCERRGWA